MDKRTAAKQGAHDGKNRAAWGFDGNTDTRTYKGFLEGVIDGDPEIMDAFSVSPLSGEWAGESISEILGARTTQAAMDAYEMAFQDAYWAELERVARYHVKAA